jgi:hypothetical protein
MSLHVAGPVGVSEHHCEYRMTYTLRFQGRAPRSQSDCEWILVRMSERENTGVHRGDMIGFSMEIDKNVQEVASPGRTRWDAKMKRTRLILSDRVLCFSASLLVIQEVIERLRCCYSQWISPSVFLVLTTAEGRDKW